MALDLQHAPPALVHDYLLVMRGAERTFAEMADVWPDAPIHTLLYDEAGTRGRFAQRQIHTSPLQALGVRQRGFRRLMPLYPTAARHLNVHAEVVVSSSSAFAHGVHTDPGAAHVCYCHSPFRYAWHEHRRALDEVPRAMRPAVKMALQRHRRFDRVAARSLTGIIANGRITAERIRRYWGRSAPIVHPPVDVDRFTPQNGEDELLFVGEVTGHKQVEVALAAAERAGRRLRVVGEGPDLPRLRQRYADTGVFLGRVDDAELERTYASSAALVVPNVEEFGIAAVEAQASGTPVIAADAGGARETVVPDETGWLVPPGDVDAMASVLARDLTGFEPERIAAHAQQFSPASFKARLLDAVDALV